MYSMAAHDPTPGRGFWHKLWRNRPDMLAVFIILSLVALRLWFIGAGQLNLFEDEAQYWDWARHPQLSYYSKGPLIAWIIAFWRNLLGDTEFAVRVGAVFNSALTQSVIYFGLSRRFKSSGLGLSVLILACLCPLFFASGIFMTTDSPLLLCWVMALFSLDLALEKKDDSGPLFMLGLCMALGVLAKYMMLFMAVIALAHGLVLHSLRLLPAHHFSRVASALVCGSALGLLPIGIWNARNDWVSFRHVATLAGVDGKKSLISFEKFFEFLGGQVGAVLPWIFALILFGSWLAFHRLRSARARIKGLENLGLSIDFSTPFPTHEALILRRDALFMAAFWPLWLLFFFWSLHTRIYVNWPGMSYAGGLMLAGVGLVELLKKWPLGDKSPAAPAPSIPGGTPGGAPGVEFRAAGAGAMPWPRKLVPPCLILSLLIFFAAHFQGYLPIPPKLNPATRAKGWSELGQRLEEIRNSMPNPDKVFFFSSSYGITAELSFYGPRGEFGKPGAYCLNLGGGRRMNQYDLWPGPDGKVGEGDDELHEHPKIGWDAVFVEYSPVGWPDQRLLEMFESGTHERFQGSLNGQPGRSLDIIILRNFNGKWPAPAQGRY